MSKMKTAFALLLVASLFAGCTQQSRSASPPEKCSGYSASFSLNASVSPSLDSIYSSFQNSKIGEVSAELQKKEFSSFPVSCPGAEGVQKPLKEGSFSCTYSDGVFDYEKSYRSLHASQKKAGASYSLIIYEQCDGKLKAYFEYSGNCRVSTEALHNELSDMLSAGGISEAPQYRLIKFA